MPFLSSPTVGPVSHQRRAEPPELAQATQDGRCVTTRIIIIIIILIPGLPQLMGHEAPRGGPPSGSERAGRLVRGQEFKEETRSRSPSRG